MTAGLPLDSCGTGMTTGGGSGALLVRTRAGTFEGVPPMMSGCWGLDFAAAAAARLAAVVTRADEGTMVSSGVSSGCGWSPIP